MKKKLRKLFERQSAIVGGAISAGRGMTDEEKAEFDSIQAQIREIENELDYDNSEIEESSEERNDETPAPNNDTHEPTREQRAAIERGERERITEIRSMCSELGIADERANELINNGTTINAAREIIINDLRSAHAPIPRAGGSVMTAGGVQVVETEIDRFTRAAVDGLLLKSSIITDDSAVDGARNFAGLTLKELAIEALRKEGVNVAMKSADQIFDMVIRSAFNPSSLFPTIMDQAIQKAYVEGHRTANVTFDIFTKKGTLTDFKKHDNNYLSGPAGEFLEVPENGELKADMITDAK